MAAVQQTRTRSARLIANITKSAQHANAGAPLTANQAPTPGPPPMSLFLTNLRLLDLDLRPDWPGIAPETFAAGGTSAQGQKKRVQCVEWALFQLFAVWDPEETKKKLKPFFPPQDQVQSVNLRAALLRALEQAKKNGALGRDAIVRKTMLDECKGERLAEVLAAFSSAVLKLVVSQEVLASREHAALASTFATEDRGYKSDNAELVALVLVHKASLSGVLRGKVSDNARFRDFSELLTIKERGLVRKNEAIQAKQQTKGGKTISEDAKLEMWRLIRNNWSGNERWMETLLYGDVGAKKDGLLGMPFDRVWRRVQQSRLAELEEHGTGLLEQLDGRVRAQKERLEKWEIFHKRLCEDRPRPTPSKQKLQPKTKGIDFGFGAHEALQVGRARKATVGTQKPTLHHDYEDLVRGLEHELSRAPQSSASLAFLQRPAPSTSIHQKTPSVDQEAVSEVSEYDEEEPFQPEPIQSFQARLDQSRRQPLRSKISLSGEWFAANTASGSRSSTEPDEYDEPAYDEGSPERNTSPDIDNDPTPVAGSPERHIVQDPEVLDPTLRDMSPSPTQELADQILESMDQVSPSPTRRLKPRHTLSLAERTRLTMARGSLAYPEQDELDLLGPKPANAPITDRRITIVADEHDDLSSRTRKSMVGFEKAKQKAQLERRKSLRKSKLPPRREGSVFPKVVEEDQDQTMVVEELMVEEDMEAVFRSRPKIAASPLPSPTREWDADEYM
ncbi:HAUS augmin-like complex subunit 6 N-terminus-domain-containing protein [Dactylonectria estremocensis]|uniref:HAUS augmin-like complex subunit 6 N-terminus-domain-containing protein n=1 Tax=Dactylonectria estremocensis TaxID=1079267 RepID=A0A9P9ITB6_9HYPO|nr:HAUS augmin-like complex subunit 6 N-terminus-domain-containing protein [Dactylonectria estremocensis]